MSDGTGIGGGGGRFPTTRGSAILATRSEDADERARAFDTLVAAYWKPVYKYIRVRWGRDNEDAKDLTQSFFLRVMEKDFLAAYDPAKGRFRTFLRTCLDRFLSNEAKAARRLKRGGDAIVLSLEFERVEGELASVDPPSGEDLDRYFDAEWVRHLFGLAVETLRAECAARGKETPFLVFERYDLEGESGDRPTYDRLAADLGIPVTTVTNHLAWARREFRRIVLETLRTITATEEEYRMEVRDVLGREPG